MFGPREMLLSSEEPVVRQFLNAQRSARSACPRRRTPTSCAGRGAQGHELPPLPPIPLQLRTSDGARAPDPARARARGAATTASPRRPARSSRERPTGRGGPVRRPPTAGPHRDQQPAPSRRPRELRRSSNPAVGALRQSRQPLRARPRHRAGAVQRPFQMAEFIQQAWFIASVTILPDRAGLASRSARSSPCSSAP